MTPCTSWPRNGRSSSASHIDGAEKDQGAAEDKGGQRQLKRWRRGRSGIRYLLADVLYYNLSLTLAFELYRVIHKFCNKLKWEYLRT